MADRKRTAPDWDDLRVFVELARQTTLSGTARKLGVNHATVARRLAHLEAALGQTLMERRPDGYGLTPAGERVLVEAGRMEQSAAALLRQVEATQGLSGPVRVSATPSIAEHLLTPHLALWHRRHPGIVIELIAEGRSVSLARRDADIAVRLARPAKGEALTRRLATIGYGLYASADYLAEAGPDRTGWAYCGIDDGTVALPEARWLDQNVASDRIVWRSNSLASQRAAALAGTGVALLPHYLARDTALIRCDAETEIVSRELWLVMQREVGRVPRMRAVADAIISAFGADGSALEIGE